MRRLATILEHPTSTTPPSTKRSPIIPSSFTPVRLYTEVTDNVEKYRITREDYEYRKVISLSSFPLYLILVAKRFNAMISATSGNSASPGHTIILRAALESGMNQLQNSSRVKRLLTLVSQAYVINAGGMMQNEAERINGTWKFTPPAPSGYHKSPGYRLTVLDDFHARLVKFGEDIGLNQSLLCVTAIAFGFYNQPEIVSESYGADDFGNVIADHVNGFDFLVEIRCEIAERIILVMRDAERRRQARAAKYRNNRNNR